MDIGKQRDDMYISEIQMVEFFDRLDEFDLRDLCNLMNEPRKTIHSCISKGQLKTLCTQLMAENIALRKLVNK